jgi:LuxR family maltose regulon positive regulatory protein
MPNARQPCIRDGKLRLGQTGQGGPTTIALNGAQWPAWQEWLAHNAAFAFYGQAGHFTARREIRRGRAYWYGYRRRAGKLYKVYLGRAEDLQPARLEEANRTLAGAPAPALPPPSLPAANTALASQPRLAWAKLTPPALPARLVERRRLTQRINTPLTLIYAPSGFGKSTLLNEWRQQCGRPVAWVTVTETENQPVRFWMLLVTAIQLSLEPAIDLAPYWQVTGEEEIPDLLAQLSSQLAQTFDATAAPRLAIVLDDYHHIRNPLINTLLQTWLEHWPPALQLILAGHIKPPLAVGRLRARGLVTELDADDLRFTVGEGVQFLQQQQPEQNSLAQRDMEALVQRTKGWASGLILAAMALAKQPDGQEFLDSFNGAHTYLREYFLENVFERQSAEMQEFLLKTAILRQLNGSLCDAVTGRQDSAHLLAWLWQENLFLVQLERQDVYQYHTMFAEALQGELQRRLPHLKADLHRRAAAWHREQQAIDDAVYHLLAIQDWEEAATLIEEIAVRELTEFGEDSRLLRWLRQLPAGVVQQHKTLLFLYVRLARMGLSAHEVQRFLANIAERIRARTPNERTADEEEVLAEIGRIRNQDGVSGAVSWRAPGGGKYAAVWQLLAELDEAAHSLFLGNREDEDASALAVYKTALQGNNLFVVLIAGGNYVAKLFLQGQLRRARLLGEQVLQHALARRGALPEPASVTLYNLASIHFERNELARSEELLARVREVDPNPTSTNMLMSAAILTARLQVAQGQGAAAQATLQAARELHARRPSGLWQDQDILAYQAWCAVRSSDLAQAQELFDRGSAQPHALSDLVRAELLLARQQPAAAAAILQTLLAEHPQHLLREPHSRTRILLALALFAQQQMHQARQLLASVVRAAAPEGLARPFLDYAAAVAPLLDLVMQQENLAAEARQFVRSLLVQMGHNPARRHQVRQSVRALAGQPGPLAALAVITPREQEVLQLLAAGHTNAEIARGLTIAASTVKTHLANIYTKLGVSNRVEAVAWLQVAQQRTNSE